MEALMAFGLCLYVATVMGLAAWALNPWILLWLVLPLVPFLFLIAVIAWVFGSAATAAVKQETGWGADGSRAYPYWVRIRRD